MSSTIPSRAKGNAAALIQARAETAARKHRDALAALRSAADHGQPLTVSTLAAAAGVSRQFLYSRSDLMEGLRRHQEKHTGSGSTILRAARTADLVNAQGTVKRLKGEIRQLQLKLEAGLAAQIELRDERRLRQLYEQRGLDINRLIADNADLSREVTQLRETVRALQDDLAVERNALNELMGSPSTVTNIRFADGATFRE
jgi:hypothetical protein